jgi:hypothetical protein
MMTRALEMPGALELREAPGVCETPGAPLLKDQPPSEEQLLRLEVATWWQVVTNSPWDPRRQRERPATALKGGGRRPNATKNRTAH